MADPYNSSLLHKELVAAGLPVEGCDSTGQISWRTPPTRDQQTTAAGVLAAHNPLKADPRTSRLTELRAKRRSGQDLTADEQKEAIDLLMGV